MRMRRARSSAGKKLARLLLALALGAIALQVQHCPGNIEAAIALHLSYEVADQRALELHYPTTGGTYHVVMLGRSLNLVITMYLIQASLLHEPQFLEQSQIAVDRSQADARILLGSTSVQIPGIQVPFGLAKGIKQQAPLRGARSVLHAARLFAIDSHSHKAIITVPLPHVKSEREPVRCPARITSRVRSSIPAH